MEYLFCAPMNFLDPAAGRPLHEVIVFKHLLTFSSYSSVNITFPKFNMSDNLVSQNKPLPFRKVPGTRVQCVLTVPMCRGALMWLNLGECVILGAHDVVPCERLSVATS